MSKRTPSDKPRRSNSLPIPLGLEGASPQPSPFHRRVTIKELAVASGLSTATISLALRNQGRLAESTRKKIFRLAEKMGYRPDPLISRLMSHLHISRGPAGQGILALLTAYKKPLTRTETYLKRALKAIVSRAERLGYLVEEFSLVHPGMTAARLRRVLRARNIQGILVAPFRENWTDLDFDLEGFAAVSVGFVLPKTRPIHATVADEFMNMKLILRNLKARGYRRIGFALELELEERSNHRWTGAFLTEQLHGHINKDPIPPLIYPTWDSKHLRPWLKKYRPDVVISTEPYVYRWILSFGYRIPEDIAFVTTSYAANLFDLPVSGIDERPEVIGSSAVDLLVAHLQRNEFGVPEVAKEVNLPGTWTGDMTSPYLESAICPSPVTGTRKKRVSILKTSK